MKEKVIKYLILLLILPIVVSLIIAITTGADTKQDSSYDSLDGTFNHKNLTYEEKVKSSNTFLYLTVFIFVCGSVGVWAYVKKKGEI